MRPKHSANIPSDMGPVAQVLLHASKQHQEYSLLDIVMSINGRSKRVGQDLKGLLSLCKLFDVFNIGVRDGGLCDAVAGLSCKCGDIVGENNGPMESNRRKSSSQTLQSLFLAESKASTITTESRVSHT